MLTHGGEIVTRRGYRALLAALCAALAEEEAHTKQTAPDNDTRRYCYEGQRLREEVRRLRREAERALREETAA